MIEAYCEEHEFVHNICHLLMDNLFPIYVAMDTGGILDANPQFYLYKRGNHDLLFPDTYQIVTNKPVVYVKGSKHIKHGFMTILNDKDKKVIPSMRPDNPPEDACGCSKPECKKTHFVAISNKRWFPYVTPFSEKILSWCNLMDAKPEQITVVKRTHFRFIMNHDELMSELAKTGLPVKEVIMENLTFRQQLEVMRKTKVFVACHGAACTHAMFLPKDSFTLEVLPYGYAYDRYQKLGIAKGDRYFQWTNPDESKSIHKWSREWLGNTDTSVTAAHDPDIIKKDGKTGEALNKANKLRGWFRDQDTIVDVSAIRNIIQKAL